MHHTVRHAGCVCVFTAITLIYGAMMTGCAVWDHKRLPPDYIKVVAIGRADRSVDDAAPSTGTLTSELLTAEASAPLEQEIEDPVTRLLAARAAARRQALRLLAADCLNRKGADGRTLRQLVESSPEQGRALENLILSRATVTLREDGGNSIAGASIDPALIDQAMGLSGDSATDNRPEELTPKPMRQQAFERAVSEAKQKLREQLLETDLGDGRSLRDAIAGDTSRQSEMDALIYLVQPVEVDYPESGVCVVTLFFDRNAVRDLGRSE